MEEVILIIRSILAEKLADQPPGDDDELLQSGVLDSVGVLDLVTRIEEAFGVHIEPADLTEDNFHNIRAIGELVNRLRSPGGTA